MRILKAKLLLLVAALTGCVSLTSEIGGEGIVYHLPKTVLTITVRQYHDPDTNRTWYALGGPTATANTFSDSPAPRSEIKAETIPDPHHRYVIKYDPSAFHDDRLCISRSATGLLTDVQFATDDRTPEVVFNIAQFVAGGLGTFTPSTKTASFEEGTDTNAKIRVRAYTGKVDPFSDGDEYAFNNALKHIFGVDIHLDFTRLRKAIARSIDTWPKGCNPKRGCPSHQWGQRCSSENLCYRTRLKLPVDLKLNHDRIDVRWADVINAWDIGSISISRAMLVQKITKLRFEEGALIAAIIRKPSEVEEATLMPLNVVNAVLTVPSGLWQAAFTDQQFKAQAIQQMAQNEKAIQNLQTLQKAMFEQGAGPLGFTGTALNENYYLNCRATKSNSINILGTSGAPTDQ